MLIILILIIRSVLSHLTLRHSSMIHSILSSLSYSLSLFFLRTHYQSLCLILSFSLSLSLSLSHTLGDDLSARMLQSIAMKAEQQISSLIAHWNADVAYMELWESYLTALEVSE